VRAMVMPQFGGAHLFEERDIERPHPGAGEMLVRVVDHPRRLPGFATIRGPSEVGRSAVAGGELKGGGARSLEYTRRSQTE